jgi:hypothetical protein
VDQEPPSSNQIEKQDDEGQMREEPKEIIFEDDSKVDEEEPVYADDKQEYMPLSCQEWRSNICYQEE